MNKLQLLKTIRNKKADVFTTFVQKKLDEIAATKIENYKREIAANLLRKD